MVVLVFGSCASRHWSSQRPSYQNGVTPLLKWLSRPCQQPALLKPREKRARLTTSAQRVATLRPYALHSDWAPGRTAHNPVVVDWEYAKPAVRLATKGPAD